MRQPKPGLERNISRRRFLTAGVVMLAAAAVLLGTRLGGGTGHHAARSHGVTGEFVDTSPRGGRNAGGASRIEALGIAHMRALARLGLPVWCAGPRGNEVAFTFDDGPGPYTYLALRKLRQAGERATFFVVGRAMSYYPGWLRREQAVAAIGDHTYHHPDLQLLANGAITSEIVSTERMIQAELGHRPQLFRPPYGARDARVDKLVERLGLLDIMWSTDSRDSLGANWAQIIRNVEAGLRPGAIILFHENHGQTIRALPTLLAELHRRHLRSVTLPELFATDPPSPALVRRGFLGCGAPAARRSGKGA
jgi:peptidoglycan/xylan/chitin deacetylase (PgdA/CDA1 family)